jgi:type I restriction enzyme S subunit
MFKKIGESMMSGAAGQKRVPTDFIQNFVFGLPPKEEQNQIVDFLEKQTTQFDELITKSKAQIILLEEKRQATINQAVTKGLDPSVPMKDSGVEWIGEIPEEWEVRRFRTICQLRQGLQIPISERFDKLESNRLPYITTKSLHANQFDDFIENPSKRVVCYENDVLLGRTGNTGEVVTDIHGVFHNNFFLIDFDKKIIEKRYLVYFLELDSVSKHILLLAGTTTIPDLNHGDFLSMQFIKPKTIAEQQQISDFLDKQTTQFDELITKSKAQITLLEEKRQALITATVTGKIDVRSEVVA